MEIDSFSQLRDLAHREVLELVKEVSGNTAASSRMFQLLQTSLSEVRAKVRTRSSGLLYKPPDITSRSNTRSKSGAIDGLRVLYNLQI